MLEQQKETWAFVQDLSLHATESMFYSISHGPRNAALHIMQRKQRF